MDIDDLTAVLAAVRSFVRDTVVPLEDQIEDNDELPKEVIEGAREMGLFGFAIPERFGGLGMDSTEQARLVMELGWTTPALRSLIGTNNGIAGHVLQAGGTPEQQEYWLPRLASGEVIGAFGLSEADAGSDPSRLTTKAVRDGDDWLLTGAKRYITNAPIADAIFVFARTDPDQPATRGIANFIVPAGTPGLTIGPHDRKMGHAGAWSSDVYLDEVRVPTANLIGGEDGIGTGFATAMRSLARGRMQIAALCVGMSQRLLEETVAWATQREQGGHLIATYQLVQGLIAESAADVLAARALLLQTTHAFDDGSDTKIGPSAAKWFASEAVGRVADRAVQVHGGAGYIRGVAVERFYRDVRLFRIYEGTSQIQQTIIARALLGAAARG